MRDDKLMLNDDKTEFLIIGTERQLSRVSVDKIKIGQAEVSPVSSVRNLGTWFDSHLDMSTHVTKACASSFYYLYIIRHIRKYLSRESTERLVHAFITSRLDYCNGLLYGAPEYQIKKLQRVMNASARLIYRAPKYCHITPLLKELYWLPVRLRVDFKILLVTFKILHGIAPSYLRPSSDAVLHMSRIEFNELSTCEVRRLNQFETAGLNLDRLSRSSRLAQPGITAVDRL